MSLCNLNGVDEIEENEIDGRKVIKVGARVTLSRLEHYFEKNSARISCRPLGLRLAPNQAGRHAGR